MTSSPTPASNDEPKISDEAVDAAARAVAAIHGAVWDYGYAADARVALAAAVPVLRATWEAELRAAIADDLRVLSRRWRNNADYEAALSLAAEFVARGDRAAVRAADRAGEARGSSPVPEEPATE